MMRRDLPEPAARFFRFVITPGASLGTKAEIEMRGAIEPGTTIVMAPQDFNEATRHADPLAVLKDGTVVAAGAAGAVRTAKRLAATFVEATVRTDPVSVAPAFFPGRVNDLARRSR